MRRVRDGKSHVGHAHRGESFPPSPALIPGLDQLETKRAKTLARHGGEQRGLVGEMAIERGSRDAQLPADGAQRDRLDPLGLDRAQRLLHEGPAEIPVMVTVGALAERSAAGPAGTRGTGPWTAW